MSKALKNAESSSKLHCRREGIKIFKKEIISKVYIGFVKPGSLVNCSSLHPPGVDGKRDPWC